MPTPSHRYLSILLFMLTLGLMPLRATTASAAITTGGGSYDAAAPPAVYRVAVQIGHYKNNELPEALSRLVGSTGTYGGGRSEVDLNFDVANRLAAVLRAQGVQVDLLPATVQTGYTADAFV